MRDRICNQQNESVSYEGREGLAHDHTQVQKYKKNKNKPVFRGDILEWSQVTCLRTDLSPYAICCLRGVLSPRRVSPPPRRSGRAPGRTAPRRRCPVPARENLCSWRARSARKWLAMIDLSKENKYNNKSDITRSLISLSWE